MFTKFWVIFLSCGLLLSCSASGEKNDIVIGEIEFPSLMWGEQKAVFNATNNSNLVKFLVVETEIQFEGAYLNPNRRARTDYIVSPGETVPVEATLVIPGNYGKANIYVRVHDVVDTLDDILPNQLVIEQPFTVNFNIPDGMLPYLQDQITLPPRVEEHPLFDNEISRLLLLLLDEGKNPSEIASLAMCDTTFIIALIKDYVKNGFLYDDNDHKNKPKFPIITTKEAEKGRKLANKLADKLASHFEKRMKEYSMTIDSLVGAGKVDADSNTFFNGGTILYHPYPVISALVMWWNLGKQFISDPEPLDIYKGSDICNAHIPNFMYAIHGGPVLRGTNFYEYTRMGGIRFRIVYGDSLPDIKCEENYILKRLKNQKAHWNPTEEYVPETFMLDSSTVQAGVNVFIEGTEEHLEKSKKKLQELAESFGHKPVTKGYLYWFWDLVATRTLDKLVDEGVITRRGNGQYRFDGVVS